ncbi:MAG: sel1 repeat family protein [Synergistaceae bacterium]|nr:sel1 repeat family protein [Synergistaceae bacterium]
MFFRVKIFVVSAILVLSTATKISVGALYASDVIYDPQYTMLALNMAIVSLHRITATLDRIVLDQEYRNIINNLNLGNIEDDPEMRELFKDLMSVIGGRALREEEAEIFAARYEMRKKNRFSKSLSALRGGGMGTWGRIAGLLASEASAYFGYQGADSDIKYEFQSELRALDSQSIKECADLQRRLLDSSWSLLRRYKLPDNYRLTQKNMDDFDKAVKETDPAKSLRMFRALEPDFKVYPPFWYYYGVSALRGGESELSDLCFAEFERVWRPVLRQDPYRAEVAKYRIMEISERNKTSSELLSQLRVMRENTPREDWVNNLFAGVMYFDAGETERGIDCVQINVDFGVEQDISGEVLKMMRDGSLDIGVFADSMRRKIDVKARSQRESSAGISSSAVSIQGLIAYFKGDESEAVTLLAGEINSAVNSSDPLPYHILLHILENGAVPEGVPEKSLIRKKRDDLIGNSSEAFSSVISLAEQYAGQKNARAEIFLGEMYQMGLGVSRDYGKAIDLFSDPAGRGMPYAQGKLGELFAASDAPQSDDAKAVEWFRKAAEQNLTWAQLKLGDMYRDGRGVPARDPEEAYMWYYVAFLNGDAGARQRLDEMDGKGLLRGKSLSRSTARRAIEKAKAMYEQNTPENQP